MSGSASAQEAKPAQQVLAQPGIRRSVVLAPRHGDILHQTGRFPSDHKDPGGHRQRLIDVMRGQQHQRAASPNPVDNPHTQRRGQALVERREWFKD